MDTKCADCKHWAKNPPDPNNLGGPALGQCRHSLHVVAIPLGPGRIQLQSMFAPVPGEFPGCAHHCPKLFAGGIAT